MSIVVNTYLYFFAIPCYEWALKFILKDISMADDKPTETNEHKPVEVRQGRSSGTVRYILMASMALAVIVAFIFFFIY